jgi:hypothetical protein
MIKLDGRKRYRIVEQSDLDPMLDTRSGSHPAAAPPSAPTRAMSGITGFGLQAVPASAPPASFTSVVP